MHFHDDVSARTPFSAVAMLLLILSTAFTGVLTDRVARDSSDKTTGPDYMDAFERVRERLLFTIRDLGDDIVEKGIIAGLNDSMIRSDVEGTVLGRLSVVDVVQDPALEGLSISFSGLNVGLDWQDAEIVDIVTSEEDGTEGEGTADHRVAARLVGTVNVSMTDDATGDTVVMPLPFDEPVAIGTALAGELLQHIAMASEGLTDVGQTVRFMLEKLAMARLFNGETDGKRLITESDVVKCLNYAIKLEMAQTFRTFDDGALSSRIEDGDGPFDIVMDEFGIDHLSASAIMSQYMMGLVDYWVLWIFDYLDIGENAEALWEKTGNTLLIGGKALQMGSIIHKEWSSHFNVKESVKEYIAQVLQSFLEVVLGALDLERIDIRQMRGGGWSSSVEMWFEEAMNRAAGDNVEMPRLELNAALDDAIRSIDGWVDLSESNPYISKFLSDIQQLLSDLTGTVHGLLKDSDILDGFVDRTIGFVWGKIQELKETLVGMVVRTVRTALAGIEGMEDMLDLRGDMMFLTGMPFTGRSTASETGSKGIETVSPVTTSVDAWSDVRTEGVHNTAPKDRVDRALRSFKERSPEELYVNVFPYQAVYNVTIGGTLTITDVDIGLVDTVTGIESHRTMAVKREVVINISFELPVSTGSPLRNVDYEPSATLLDDLMNALDQAWNAIKQFPNAIVNAGHAIVNKLVQLGQTAMENLMKQNALWFYKTMNQLGKAIYEHNWSKGLEAAMKICEKLIGKDLTKMMTLSYKFDGIEVYFAPNICSGSIEIGFRSEHLSFALEVKQHVNEFMKGHKMSFLIKGSIAWGNFNSDTSFDPFVLTQDAMFKTGIVVKNVCGRDLIVDLTYPQLVEQFARWEIGIQTFAGGMLRIPLPPGFFVKVDAGIRVRYKSYEKVAFFIENITEVVKETFQETLGQFTIGEILGTTFDMDTLESFLVQLLQNIVDSFRDFLDKTVPEIEFFIKADVEDPSSSGQMGFGLSFVIKQPVSWLFSIAMWIMENVRNFITNLCKFRLPGGLTAPPAHMMDYLFIRIEVFMRVGTPEFMKKLATGAGGTKIPTELLMGFRLELSLATILGIMGFDFSRFHVTFGLVVPDVPAALVAWWPKVNLSKKMAASDLWFIRGDIWFVKREKLLISEVMYEPNGSDSDLEYVEIFNPSSSRVDLNGWSLKDNAGSWTIPEGEIPPGEHWVFSKKGNAFKAAYGVSSEAEGMTLNLNNAGDKVLLIDARGEDVDKVAWEGVDGWDVLAEKGNALLRDESVDDSDGQGEWYYGPPSPGEANAG